MCFVSLNQSVITCKQLYFLQVMSSRPYMFNLMLVNIISNNSKSQIVFQEESNPPQCSVELNNTFIKYSDFLYANESNHLLRQSAAVMTYFCRPNHKLVSHWFLLQKVFLLGLPFELLQKINSVHDSYTFCSFMTIFFTNELSFCEF